MLQFSTELGGTSRVVFGSYNVSSLYPNTGYCIPGYAPDMYHGSTFSMRSRLDSISNGPARAHGDHECDNTQFSATITCPSVLTGDVVPWSPSNGIPVLQDVSPSSVFGYSYEQLLAVWGKTKSPSHVFKHRDADSGFAPRSIPDLPMFLEGHRTARAYAAKNDSSFGLFYVQEMAMCVCTKPGATSNQAVFGVSASWVTVYDYDGKVTRSSGTASAAFSIAGPSAPGASDRVGWYPNPQGIWTTAYQTIALPPFLVGFSRSDFESFLEDPGLLGAWQPQGVDTLSTVPSWSSGTVPASSWPDSVTATIPPLYDSAEAAELALAEYFSPLRPTITASSEVDDWQELGDTAADNLMQTSVNHFANSAQLTRVFGSLKSTLQLIKGYQNPKAWANWWLSLRYGDRLTLKDISTDSNAVFSEVFEKTKTWVKSFYTSHSMSQTTGTPAYRLPAPSITHYLKMYYTFRDYGAWGKAYIFTRKWSLWPTTEELWDVIPLSFVVDWFIDVSDLFAEFDRDTLCQYIDVSSVITTEKKTYDVGDLKLGNFLFSGVKITHYSRSLGTRLPSGPFRCDRGHASAINVVDGISLIIQAT